MRRTIYPYVLYHIFNKKSINKTSFENYFIVEFLTSFLWIFHKYCRILGFLNG